MTSSTKQPEGALTVAARALEAEIAKYEHTLRDLEGLEIVSEKTLQRARRSLEDCAERQQKLAEHLQAFAAAMNAAQARQQQCMDATALAVQRVRERFEARSALLERVAALGERAKEINEPVAAVVGGEPKDDAETTSALLTSLDAVSKLTEEVIAEADAVRQSAKDDAWEDIARDADALRQQLTSARNKVLLVQRSVAARAPS